MFMRRICGRILSAAAHSEYSTANAIGGAASSSSSTMARNPLEQFFEVDRAADDEKRVVYGRGWKASELRLKSWDDLHKLWYVLLKEKNMLMTQRQMLNAQNLRFPNPERLSKAWTKAPSMGSALVSMLMSLPKLKFVIVTLGEEGCIMLQRFDNADVAQLEEMNVDQCLASLNQKIQRYIISSLFCIAKAEAGSSWAWKREWKVACGNSRENTSI